jgi:CubicO group peptidase (beta-lactamase class C family)
VSLVRVGEILNASSYLNAIRHLAKDSFMTELTTTYKQRLRLAALSLLGLLCALSVMMFTKAEGKIIGNPLREHYQQAADYSQSHGGLSFLAVKDGQIVFEQYSDRHSADKPHRLASGTKSFSCALAAAGVRDGLLALDEKVSDTLTEWRSDARRQITIRQLLSLTSGIPGGTFGRVPTYAQAIKTEAQYEPGTKFQYGPIPFQIFGEVMRRKLASRREDPLDYLTQRVFNAIGMRIASWRRNQDGNPNLPSGAFVTAREWAKFGILIANGGQWEGKQILPKNLLTECFEGSRVNPVYGLTFWLNGKVPSDLDFDQIGRPTRSIYRRTSGQAQSLGDRVPSDLVMAAGAGNQRLYIIPSLNLVVVRQGERALFKDDEFLARLFGGVRASTSNVGKRSLL